MRFAAIKFPFNPLQWSVWYLALFFLLLWWQQGLIVLAEQGCNGESASCFVIKDKLASAFSITAGSSALAWSDEVTMMLLLGVIWLVVFSARAAWLYYQLYRVLDIEYQLSFDEFEQQTKAWRGLLFKQLYWLGFGAFFCLVHGLALSMQLTGWSAWLISSVDLLLLVVILNYRVGKSTIPTYNLLMHRYRIRLLLLVGMIFVGLLLWLVLEQISLVTYATCENLMQCYRSFDRLFIDGIAAPRQLWFASLLLAVQLLVWILVILVRYTLIPKLLALDKRKHTLPLLWLQPAIPVLWAAQFVLNYEVKLVVSLAVALCGSWVLGVWIRFALAQPADGLHQRVQSSERFRLWLEKYRMD